MNIDDFIKNHKHINYCEAILFEDGSIDYAIPSHQEYLVAEYMKRTGMSKEEVWEEIPITASPIDWLIDKTKCIIIWYDSFMRNKTITQSQFNSLSKLKENKIINPNAHDILVEKTIYNIKIKRWDDLV